ncbi:hypothetical protein BY458DRAFT_500963 [Sporodiniella umbellata]|nr:hypothetical protein BY458DRAFT_500963 [Sporodiniella umbellata]
MEEIYPIYISSCILNNNLQEGRYIRKRLQAQKMNTEEIEAIWSIAVAHIKKAYSVIYSAIDQYTWTEKMQLLVAAIKEKSRAEMLTLIPKVYSSIEIEQVCDFFGLSQGELLPELMNRGWNYDEGTKILRPVKTSQPVMPLTSVNQFSKLAEVILQLEKV